MKLLEIENNLFYKMQINIDNILYIQKSIDTPGTLITLVDGTVINDNRTVSELKKELNEL